MPIETHGSGALGATYHGFSRPAPAPEARPILTRERLIAGACAALVLGAGLAVWASPQTLRELAPLYVSTPAPVAEGQVRIVLREPAAPAPAAARRGPRLEVLPADMAAAASRGPASAEVPVVHVAEPQSGERVHARFAQAAWPPDEAYDEPRAPRAEITRIAPPPEPEQPAFEPEPWTEPPAGF